MAWAVRHHSISPLVPTYGWFTEGFDTADLQDAKALLGELYGAQRLQYPSSITCRLIVIA